MSGVREKNSALTVAIIATAILAPLYLILLHLENGHAPSMEYVEMGSTGKMIPSEVGAYVVFTTQVQTPPHYDGGGVCVQQEDGFCYVLTAAHVCVTPGLNAMDFEGNLYSFQYVDIDFEADLCLVSVYGQFSASINSIAVSMNPWSDVYNFASPLGHFHSPPAWMLLRFEGQWSGYFSEHLLVYTFPAQGGSSGSAIFHEGSIAGLVMQRPRDLEAISYAVAPHFIIRFLVRNGIMIEFTFH